MSPYCSVEDYRYFAHSDVAGNQSLGAALVETERECARACCDVPGCDGYSFSTFTHGSNCFFVGSVTYVTHSHAFSSGIRKRAL